MMSDGSRPEGPTVSGRSRHSREDASGAEETRTLRMVSTHPLLRAAEKAQPYPMNECMAGPDPDSRASRPVRVAPGVAPRPLAKGALSPGIWRGVFGASPALHCSPRSGFRFCRRFIVDLELDESAFSSETTRV